MRLIIYITLILFLPALSFEALSQNPIPPIDTLPDVTIRPDVLIKERKISQKPTRFQLDRRRLKCYMPPEFIVNGKRWKYYQILNLEPDDIIRIEVLKRPYPWRKYRLRKNITGIVLITTKNKR